MRQTDGDPAQSVDRRKRERGFIAAEKPSRKEVADDQDSERSEHVEESDSERTHAEDKRAETGERKSERIISPIAVVGVVRNITAAHSHLRNGHKQFLLFL